VEDSDVTKAKESEDGQVQNQGDVDCFFDEGHCTCRILVTGPDHQPAHLQGRPAAFDAVSAREEVTNARKKIMAASPRQCSGTQCIDHPGMSCQYIIAVLEQPPYSPDLAPCVSFLFHKLKGVMRRTRFPDVEAITMAMTKDL